MSTTDNSKRYAEGNEIARGGMGVILQVKDRDLDRTLAMKRMLSAPDVAGGEVEVDRFARFMEEAHVTAQLDHPAIVPVHELGADEDGTAWYTMKMVRGRELGEVIKLARDGDEGWNLPRLVGVLVRVCQAVAYAHGKGVIHRDLKPANIMVGDLGEVYVMDWGLAKQLGREDVHDIRLKLGDEVTQSGMDTIVSPRASESESGSSLDAPLMTMDGAVVGTPAYMPPEQAAGIVDQVDHLSDIYALGAVLYEILAAQSPYMDTVENTSPKDVLTALSNGPPTQVKRIRPAAPAALVAICEKAMSRQREGRYESCLDFADDLQAFLDGRVVQAHETGRWAEFKKLVLRNKATSAAAAATVLLLASLAVVQTVSNRKLATSLANEEAARVETTLTVADMHRNAGLREKQPLRAALWFAAAATKAEGDPQRVFANQTRAQTWTHDAWPPLRAFHTLATEAALRFTFHPDKPLLIVETYRGMEIWDYERETALALPQGRLAAASFSPDGSRLATAVEGGAVHVWDVSDLAQTAEIPHSANALAFDPGGGRLALGNKKVLVWNLERGAQEGELLTLPKKARWLSFLPEGDALAVTYRHELRIYDLADPSAPRFGPVSNDGYTLAMRPLLRGGLLYATPFEKPEQASHARLQVWDLRSGKELVDRNDIWVPIDVGPRGEQVLHAGGVWDVPKRRQSHTLTGDDYGERGAIHPGGGIFLSGQDALYAYSASNSQRLHTVSQTPVKAARWNAEGTLLALGTSGGLVKIHRTAARPAVAVLANEISVRQLVASEDGDLLANPNETIGGKTVSGFGSRSIQARHSADGRPAGPRIIPGGLPLCAAFGEPGSGVLAVGTGDEYNERFSTGFKLGAVQRFDFRSGEALGVRQRLPSEPAHLVRDGETFLVLCLGGEIMRFGSGDAPPQQIAKAQASIPETERRNGRLRLLDGGRTLLVSNWERVECYDLPSGDRRWVIGRDVFKGGAIVGDAVAGGKLALCTGSPYPVDVGIVVTDLATGTKRERIDAGDLGANWVEFDAAGEQLLVAAADNRARLLETATWQPLSSPVEHTRPGAAASFLPGLPWVASAGSNDDLHLWDPNSGLDIAPPLGINGSLWMESTADGKTLLLCSRNNRKVAAIELQALHDGLAGELSARDALRLAELNANAVIDASGNLNPMGEDAWLERWQQFRKAFPDFPGHALAMDKADLIRWHREGALGAQSRRAVVYQWHLRRWQELAPEHPEPLGLMFAEGMVPHGDGDFQRWFDLIFAHPAYRKDPQVIAQICSLQSRHGGDPAWGKLERGLRHLLGYNSPPATDPALRPFIAERKEFPADIRTWLTDLLFDPPPPPSVETGATTGGESALGLLARWEVQPGAEREIWRNLENLGDDLKAVGGAVGVFLSDPARCPLAGSKAFTVAVRFRPDGSYRGGMQQGHFYEAAQLVSADFPYDAADWGLGYADDSVWFGVGDPAGGTPTLGARPDGIEMGERWWTVVAGWTADAGKDAPAIALWLIDDGGEIAASAGPVDPNEVVRPRTAGRFRAPRHRTGIAVGADRGDPSLHRFRGGISDVRLYRGAAATADAVRIAGEVNPPATE